MPFFVQLGFSLKIKKYVCFHKNKKDLAIIIDYTITENAQKMTGLQDQSSSQLFITQFFQYQIPF